MHRTAKKANKNIFLEQKLKTLSDDFPKKKNDLLAVNLDLQNKYDDLKKTKKSEA